MYHNAFSSKTTNPKIPDGKCYNSAGLRLQAVKEFVNDSTGDMDFLFFPGINNAIIAASVTDAETKFGMPFGAHFDLDADLKQSADAEIARWRLVSSAMKVSLTNNSDENDGWWEAIRVQLNPGFGFDDGFEVKVHDGGTRVVGPNTPNTIPGMNLGITSLVEHPTYTAGKLRDIHRHVFDLMPQGTDHDFNDLSYDMTGNNALMMDFKNYDAIFLRVHGRPGSSTPTRVMVHVVSNQEILYQESSPLARYHSEADNHNAIFQSSKRKRQNGDHKAAKKQRTSLLSYS